MKIIGVLFLLFVSVKGFWYENRLAEIKLIDETATVKKSIKKLDRKNTSIITKFKLNKFRKLSWQSLDSDSLHNFNCNFYHDGSFLFAQDYFSTSFLYQKGIRQVTDPLGVIEEGRIVFDTKKSGIKLKRSISYFKNSEIDSLREVLKKMPFDTLEFSEFEYSKAVKSYKRMKSFR